MENTKARYFRYTLHFREPAGTSRGVLREKDTWFLLLSRGDVSALGECAMFRGLSCDDVPGYEGKLDEVCRAINRGEAVDPASLADYPSIRFGLECAQGTLLAREEGKDFLASDFTAGLAAIPVNGLVWMGDFERMARRLEEKIEAGYRCIKIKIGAIDFGEELSLLRRIRQRYNENDIEIRVDANGAFSPDDALERLKCLSDFRLHSIEQPIRAGQWAQMARLCRKTPLPIALDEELIGVNIPEEKRRLTEEIKPRYIVLKPSLVGGMASCREWIDLAEASGAGFWLTSALESNVGLDAIARFSYLCKPAIPQGLGTGALYTDNVDYPFEIRGGMFRITGKVPGTERVLEALRKQN